jgi:N-acetylmuramoyl-L-alanine amidase
VSGRFLTDLADICRGAGLDVVEVDGWQTRARSSGGYADGRPWCVMWHHTASQTSPANDVSYIVSGSPDAPLANLYLARDGTVYVCAAGATNTNGKGGPLPVSRGTVPADSMNTYAVGIEAANNGTGEFWPQAQIDAYFTLSNALTDGYGLAADDVASHNAWAPDRKIDPATANAVQGPWQPGSINSSGTWSVEDLRGECRRRSSTTPTPPTPTPPEGDDMRAGPYLIQATGRDGTPGGRVYATDGNAMTLRWLSTKDALDGYRWQAVNVFGWQAPELQPDGPIMAVDTIAAFGVVLE